MLAPILRLGGCIYNLTFGHVTSGLLKCAHHGIVHKVHSEATECTGTVWYGYTLVPLVVPLFLKLHRLLDAVQGADLSHIKFFMA